jgi:hypothetical protein
VVKLGIPQKSHYTTTPTLAKLPLLQPIKKMLYLPLGGDGLINLLCAIIIAVTIDVQKGILDPILAVGVASLCHPD